MLESPSFETCSKSSIRNVSIRTFWDQKISLKKLMKFTRFMIYFFVEKLESSVKFNKFHRFLSAFFDRKIC